MKTVFVRDSTAIQKIIFSVEAGVFVCFGIHSPFNFEQLNQ
jgi:hypothetical protein